MRPTTRFLFCPFLAVLSWGGAIGEEGVANAPKSHPRIRQVTLPNPVVDPMVLIHRGQLTPAPVDGVITQLPGLIEVRHPESGISYAWDPIECRLMFLWRGESMAQPILIAEGPGSLAGTVGAFGAPEYFGYRLIKGVPEFLYHYGRLSVTERIEPGADGTSLVQHFAVHQADFDLMVAVPERWQGLVKPSAGKWTDHFMTIPKGNATRFSLAWSIAQPPKLPALPPGWAAAVAALAPETPVAQPEVPTKETKPPKPSGQDPEVKTSPEAAESSTPQPEAVPSKP